MVDNPDFWLDPGFRNKNIIPVTKDDARTAAAEAKTIATLRPILTRLRVLADSPSIQILDSYWLKSEQNGGGGDGMGCSESENL